MTHKLTHPSVLASAATGATLAVLSTQRPLPVWLWLAWGALSAVSIVQAARSER